MGVSNPLVDFDGGPKKPVMTRESQNKPTKKKEVVEEYFPSCGFCWLHFLMENMRLRGFWVLETEASFCGSFILSNFGPLQKYGDFPSIGNWFSVAEARKEQRKESASLNSHSVQHVFFFQLIKIEGLAGNPESMRSPPNGDGRAVTSPRLVVAKTFVFLRVSYWFFFGLLDTGLAYSVNKFSSIQNDLF